MKTLTCNLEVFLPEHVDKRRLSGVRDTNDENVRLWISRAMITVGGLNELDRSGNYLKIPTHFALGLLSDKFWLS